MDTLTQLRPRAQPHPRVRHTRTSTHPLAVTWQQAALSHLIHAPRNITQRLVLMVLVCLADNDGYVSAYLDEIALVAGIHKGSVKRTIRELVSAGLLLREHRGRPNTWRIVLHRPVAGE